MKEISLKRTLNLADRVKMYAKDDDGFSGYVNGIKVHLTTETGFLTSYSIDASFDGIGLSNHTSEHVSSSDDFLFVSKKFMDIKNAYHKAARLSENGEFEYLQQKHALELLRNALR